MPAFSRATLTSARSIYLYDLAGERREAAGGVFRVQEVTPFQKYFPEGMLGRSRSRGDDERDLSKCTPARVTTMGCNITRAFSSETVGGEGTEGKLRKMRGRVPGLGRNGISNIKSCYYDCLPSAASFR